MDLMKQFLEKWGKPYGKARSILAYLGTYPEVLVHAELDDLVEYSDLDDSQEAWLRLCSKFVNPLEKDFFKPYWIPIKRDSYDVFIDISDEAFPLFEAHFFFIEPYRWYKHPITSDISELMLVADKTTDIKDIFLKHDQNRWLEISTIFDDRMESAFRGELEVKDVSLEEIENEQGINHRINSSEIVVLNVKSPVAGLLPYTQSINLSELEYLYGDPFESLDKVSNIRDLVFLIRTTGSLRIASYKAELVDNPGHQISFVGDKFVFNFSDQELADEFVAQLTTRE